MKHQYLIVICLTQKMAMHKRFSGEIRSETES